MKPGRYAARTADEAYTGRLLNHVTEPAGQLETPAQRESVSSPRNQGIGANSSPISCVLQL